MTEHDIQSSFISWCNESVKYNRIPELDMIFAIPNGSNKSIAAAMKFKREGLKSGVPDLMLPVARGQYNGLFLEFKRNDKQKLSDNQLEWFIKLEKQGYKCVKVSDRDTAINVVKGYLSLSMKII